MSLCNWQFSESFGALPLITTRLPPPWVSWKTSIRKKLQIMEYVLLVTWVLDWIFWSLPWYVRLDILWHVRTSFVPYTEYKCELLSQSYCFPTNRQPGPPIKESSILQVSLKKQSKQEKEDPGKSTPWGRRLFTFYYYYLLKALFSRLLQYGLTSQFWFFIHIVDSNLGKNG